MPLRFLYQRECVMHTFPKLGFFCCYASFVLLKWFRIQHLKSFEVLKSGFIATPVVHIYRETTSSPQHFGLGLCFYTFPYLLTLITFCLETLGLRNSFIFELSKSWLLYIFSKFCLKQHISFFSSSPYFCNFWNTVKRNQLKLWCSAGNCLTRVLQFISTVCFLKYCRQRC